MRLAASSEVEVERRLGMISTARALRERRRYRGFELRTRDVAV